MREKKGERMCVTMKETERVEDREKQGCSPYTVYRSYRYTVKNYVRLNQGYCTPG